MIALELLFFFIVIGLGTVGFLQWHGKRNHPDRGHKGDAHKTAEEEELHKKLAHK
ncbi:MAG: hypothetical protein JJU05_12525 [Verrucomicrobia bacterium]|nr:hypothetical protein [Verrucomicrobiota bacterium]MCH8528404.1 hypothetical protein [Kiritimatiellia bacterium]